MATSAVDKVKEEYGTKEGVLANIEQHRQSLTGDALAAFNAMPAKEQARTAYIADIREAGFEDTDRAMREADKPAPQVARSTPADSTPSNRGAREENVDRQIELREQILEILKLQLNDAQQRDAFMAGFDAAEDKTAYVRREGPAAGIDPQEMEAIFAQRAARPRVELPPEVAPAGTEPPGPEAVRRQLEAAVDAAGEGMDKFAELPGSSTYKMYEQQYYAATEALQDFERAHGMDTRQQPRQTASADVTSAGTPQRAAFAPAAAQPQTTRTAAPVKPTNSHAPIQVDPNSKVGLTLRYNELVEAGHLDVNSDRAAGIRTAINSDNAQAYAQLRISEVEREAGIAAPTAAQPTPQPAAQTQAKPAKATSREDVMEGIAAGIQQLDQRSAAFNVGSPERMALQRQALQLEIAYNTVAKTPAGSEIVQFTKDKQMVFKQPGDDQIYAIPVEADMNTHRALSYRYEHLAAKDPQFINDPKASTIRIALRQGGDALLAAEDRIASAEHERFGKVLDGRENSDVSVGPARVPTQAQPAASAPAPKPEPKPARPATGTMVNSGTALDKSIATIANGGNTSLNDELGLTKEQGAALQGALLANGQDLGNFKPLKAGMEPGQDGHVGASTLQAYYQAKNGSEAPPFNQLNAQQLASLAQDAAAAAQDPQQLAVLANPRAQTAQIEQENPGIDFVQAGDTPDSQAAQAQREADMAKAEPKQASLDMEKALAALKKGFDGQPREENGPDQSNLKSQINGGEHMTDAEEVDQAAQIEFDEASRLAGQEAAQRQAELQAAMQGFDPSALKGGKAHADVEKPTGRVVTENMAEAEAAKAAQTGNGIA